MRLYHVSINILHCKILPRHGSLVYMFHRSLLHLRYQAHCQAVLPLTMVPRKVHHSTISNFYLLCYASHCHVYCIVLWRDDCSVDVYIYGILATIPPRALMIFNSWHIRGKKRKERARKEIDYVVSYKI